MVQAHMLGANFWYEYYRCCNPADIYQLKVNKENNMVKFST